MVVVQPQFQVLYRPATHPSSEDDDHASGLSSKADDVLGHAANWGVTVDEYLIQGTKTKGIKG